MPRCTECRIKKSRDYHSSYKRAEWEADRIRRGLPVSGDLVTARCGWCEKEFTFVSHSGRSRTKCQDCKKRSGTALRAAWDKAHPEERTVFKRKYNTSARGKAVTAEYNRSARFRKYGLSEEQFGQLLRQQGNRCAICGTTEPGGRHGAWEVDHDRSCCRRSGSCGDCVRGLLCSACNKGIGLLRDDPAVLIAAAAYIKRTHQMKLFIA